MVDFIYKKSGSIFNQHSYWTKQPVDVIEYFIKKFTQEGEVVLDPFAGSGMTGIASILNNRESILIDNSPTAVHIAKGYTSKINFEKEVVNEFLEKIKSSLGYIYQFNIDGLSEPQEILFDVIGEVYETKEGIKLTDSYDYFQSIKHNKPFSKQTKKDLKFLNHEIVVRFYKNSKTNKKDYVRYDQNFDFKINKILEKSMKDHDLSFLERSFFGKEPKRNIKKGIDCVADIYSRKNLFVLLEIKKEIDKIKNLDLKEFLMYCFTSIVFNTSLMSRYRKYENTSIKMGTYYIPPLIKDNNVINSFSSKVLKTYDANIGIFKKTKQPKCSINLGDASNLSNIKTNSIDFIYTDPPYGGMISYSELNFLIECWLDIEHDYKNEMIIDLSSKKTSEYYFELFEKFLNEASRVLKKNRSMILVFHNTNLNVWKDLQKVILNSKFLLKTQNEPFRLVSKNKTSSQHNTNKNMKSFLVFELVNTCEHNSKKLSKLTINRLDKLILKSKKFGDLSKSEKYDFFINSTLNNYDLNLENDVKDQLNEFFLN